MYEDMDRKAATRPAAQAVKTSSVDSKFKQDGASKFSRSVRRGDGAQRQDASRKPNPRKTKNVQDKRPRPRGYVNLDRDRSEVGEGNYLLEAGELVKPGSKKVNLNHLLNFTFAKRDQDDHFGGGGPVWNSRFKQPKYNKEQFLQANCQFVVKKEADYSIHMVDPDILVEWALVEQVMLPTYEVPSCPICLYPATAAKITRCGHVYCWVCILHYLALSEKSWHKCPICYEAVHKQDLKSMVTIMRTAPKAGEEISLTLMRRERGSLISVPAVKWTKFPSNPFSLGDDLETSSFQKLLMANISDVMNIAFQEQEELKILALDNDYNSELPFIEIALELVHERQRRLDSGENNNDTVKQTLDSNLNLTFQMNPKAESAELGLLTEENDLVEELLLGESDSELAEIKGNQGSNSCTQKNTFYYYQASDGQHIYMHSLNVRMLIAEYGGLESCPTVIKAKIVEVDNVTMTKLLRNRLRYLQHLPLTCQFQMVELYFEAPLISEQVKEQFSGDIEKRRRVRTRKQREERRRERHIELEENKKIGKFPSAQYSLNSFKHFPAYNSISTDDDPPLCTNDFSPLSLNESPSPDASAPVEGSVNSFAQMLQKGKTRSDVVRPEKVESIIPSAVNNNSEDENWAPPPEYHVSFGDAIQEAMNSISLTGETGNDKKGRRKKGKNKNTLLFTTSMNRSK